MSEESIQTLNKYMRQFVNKLVYLCLIYSGTTANADSYFSYTQDGFKIKNVYKKPDTYKSICNFLTIKHKRKKIFVCRWDYIRYWDKKSNDLVINSIDKFEVESLENLKNLFDIISTKIELLDLME